MGWKPKQAVQLRWSYFSAWFTFWPDRADIVPSTDWGRRSGKDYKSIHRFVFSQRGKGKGDIDWHHGTEEEPYLSYRHQATLEDYPEVQKYRKWRRDSVASKLPMSIEATDDR